MDIPAIVQQQKEFFKTQKTKDLSYRKDALRRLRAEVIRREKEITDAIHADFRKPEFESIATETRIVLNDLDHMLRKLNRRAKPHSVFPALLNFPSGSRIYPEPYGTVLIIAPWNYPYQLTLSPLIGAIAAGNTVVLKPSELTPHTSGVISSIVAAVFDKGHVCVVEGDAGVAEKLLNERWDYIFFTGSIQVGKIVAKSAALNLTPFTLELGGKSPCVIDRTANLKLAAKRITWGKFINGGQTCIAPDYILIHSSVKDEFIHSMKNEIKCAYGDDPFKSTDFPRIINLRNFLRLKKMLENERVILGGETDEGSLYIAPTLLDNPGPDSEVMKEEIFGPVLPVLDFDDETGIERIVSAYEKPLSFYVFSNDRKFAGRLIRRYSFGGGTINDTAVHFADPHLPFGGVGHSGMGAYHGKYSFDTFTHLKGITRRYNWPDIPLRYAPYAGKMKLLKFFMKWLG
ncbi:MAG: aldehyde dehydrogenase [Bacteroidetes bacterium]|nr:aldehyde dehydrogenase [Bacteroidota bacterium]